MDAIPDWARRARAHWRYRGQERPPFALEPGPGQESVWDYPRPPRIDRVSGEVLVRHGGVVLARSARALRVLETASPPTVYLPPDDVTPHVLVPASGSSRCEWKGTAAYWSVVLPDERLDRVAWSYPAPLPEFEALAGYVSFYPALVECWIGGARAEPQPGGFYGGWVTPEIVGPMKGWPGTESW
jgi:uncharacterized protein (DUF427 family)